jgi:hypothetical protein
MLAMDGFDLLFEGLVFGGQLPLAIDILALDPQCFRTHGLDPSSAR